MIRFDVSSLMGAVMQTIEQATPDEGALRAATFAGAEIFRDEAKRNAQSHIQTGTIWRSIIVKRIEEESNGATRQVYKVTVRKGRYGGDDGYYWRFVEFGHRFVPKKKKKNTTWKAHRRAAELEYGTASAPAYPFMRPAYDSKRQEAVDAMSKTLREQLERNSST
jgi:HK97 gp10 family phage protein